MTIKKKSQGIPKSKKHRLKRWWASEPDMEGMLELSDWKFKTTMINTLRALLDEVGHKQEQMR